MHNHLRTFMLLAGLTALFVGVGYLIGGAAGMAIALAIAVVVATKVEARLVAAPTVDVDGEVRDGLLEGAPVVGVPGQ